MYDDPYWRWRMQGQPPLAPGYGVLSPDAQPDPSKMPAGYGVLQPGMQTDTKATQAAAGGAGGQFDLQGMLGLLSAIGGPQGAPQAPPQGAPAAPGPGPKVGTRTEGLRMVVLPVAQPNQPLRKRRRGLLEG